MAVNNNDEEAPGFRGLGEENANEDAPRMRMTADEEGTLSRTRGDAAPPGQWRPPTPDEIIPSTTTSRNHSDSSRVVVRGQPQQTTSNAVLRRFVVPLLEERGQVPRGDRGPSYNYYNESPAPRCTTNQYQQRRGFCHPLRNLPPELFSFSLLLSHCEGEQDHHQQQHPDGRDHHGDDSRRVAGRRSPTAVLGGVTSSSPTAREYHDHDHNENIREGDNHDDKSLENNSRRYLHVLRTIEAALRTCSWTSSSSEDDKEGDDGENGTENNP